jgi:uncharacterized protein (DUF4415 family)
MKKIVRKTLADDPVTPAGKRKLAQLAARNPFYRPVKQQLTVRLDADVVAWLRKRGRGYQTRLNQVLRRAMVTRWGRARDTWFVPRSLTADLRFHLRHSRGSKAKGSMRSTVMAPEAAKDGSIRRLSSSGTTTDGITKARLGDELNHESPMAWVSVRGFFAHA